MEGIYFFGGRDEKGAKNKLFVLKIGQKMCEWVEPRIEGPVPLARYSHTMNYYPQKAVIVLFGGRNDENFASAGMSYLNDVWVLSLEKLSWTMWNKEEGQGPTPSPRYSHCSAMFEASIIVFGGLSEDNYCRADVHALDMENNNYKSRLEYELTRKQPLALNASTKLSEREGEEDIKRVDSFLPHIVPAESGSFPFHEEETSIPPIVPVDNSNETNLQKSVVEELEDVAQNK